MTQQELDAYQQDKKLDIIDEQGIINHYNMNDYGWVTHAQGYQAFGEEVCKYKNIPELKRLVKSDEVMDYYKIEHILIVGLQYFSHKSWIDEDKEYHHFCYSKSGLSNSQLLIYENMKKKYGCQSDNLWDSEEINYLCGDIFEIDLNKIKNHSHL